MTKNINIQNVIAEIEKQKVIAIIRGVSDEDLIPLVDAMYEGGIRLVEITYGTKSDEATANSIKMLAERFAGRMYVGAGTVLTKKQVALTKKVGGSFIISPDCNPQIIKKTKRMKMVSIPGVLTPSEITTAVRSGADFVKVFPVNVMGPDYIKAVKAPLANVKVLAVGSVAVEDMPKYLEAGASGFGIGSTIVNKKLIAEKKFDEIAEISKQFIERLK